MGGVFQSNSSPRNISVDNRGIINLVKDTDGSNKKFHFNGVHLTLQNYALKITQNPTTFNSFNSNNATDNSHLILDSIKSVKFADKHSKLILDFGNSFEFGKGYLFSKLVMDIYGNNALNVDFSRLTTRTSLYKLTQNGDNFIVNFAPQYGIIGTLHKSNIRTMNNFYTISNLMIYPHKYKIAMKRAVKKKRVIRMVKKVANLFNDSLLRDSTQRVESWQSTNNNDSWIASANRKIRRSNDGGSDSTLDL